MGRGGSIGVRSGYCDREFQKYSLLKLNPYRDCNRIRFRSRSYLSWEHWPHRIHSNDIQYNWYSDRTSEFQLARARFAVAAQL